MITEGLGTNGRYIVEITKKDGSKEVKEFPNMITNGYLDFLAYITTLNSSYDLGFRYMALGKDGGEILPLNGTNTRLGQEVFRKQFTTVDRVGSTVTRTVVINSDEANHHIKEIGIFAGSGATSTANTGILVSRVLFDYDKDELESIKITRIDSFGRL